LPELRNFSFSNLAPALQELLYFYQYRIIKTGSAKQLTESPRNKRIVLLPFGVTKGEVDYAWAVN